MKNILLKISIFTLAIFAFVGTASLANAQYSISDVMPIAAPFLEQTNCAEGTNCLNWGNSDQYGYGRRFNQNPVGEWGMNKIEQSFPGAMLTFAGMGLVFMIFAILLLAFWIWMLVHAIKHDIDYKPVWILVLWFANIIGAIIYFFAVKRHCPCCENLEEVCICEDGACVCGKVNSENIKNIEEDHEDHNH